MAERVGDRQQQAVGRGQRSRQTTGRHHARDHVGQACDLRRGQHDDVAADAHLTQLEDAVLVDVRDGQQRRIHLRPGAHPGRQLVKRRAHQDVEHLVLDQDCQCRRREVQQEDEEQRPGHRLARFLHRRRGVVAHQDVRQRGGTHHQAEHQAQEVAARGVESGLGLLVPVRVTRELLRMARHACQRRRARVGAGLGSRPGLLGGFLVGGHGGQRLLGGLHLGQRGAGSLQVFHLLLSGSTVGSQGGRHVLQLGSQGVRLRLEDATDFLLFRVGDELLLTLGHLGQLGAIDGLRNGDARLLHRQPHHRNHVGNDQDDVLRHLRPGHCAHAAQERAHQDAAQTNEHADLEGQAGQARGDQTHTVDLGHHVHERHQDGDQDAHEASRVTLIAGAEEVGDRELTKLAQVRRQKQRHQAVASRPAHDEGQTAVAGEVQRAGHADEGRRAHPVCAGGHAVVDGRHAAASHVVLGRIVGAAHDADAGVQGHRGDKEHDTDGAATQAHLLGDGQHHHEGQEPAGVPAVNFVEALLEGRIGLLVGDPLLGFERQASHVTPPRQRRVLGPACSCSRSSSR